MRERCIICDGPIYGRGLCRLDYRAAAAKVRNGLTTWAEMETAGNARPAGAAKRKLLRSLRFRRHDHGQDG
jgi:hypothetical protein